MKSRYQNITSSLANDDKCIDLGYRYLLTGL